MNVDGPSVTVGLKLHLRASAGRSFSYDSSIEVIEQICDDALSGTYGIARGGGRVDSRGSGREYGEVGVLTLSDSEGVVEFDLALPEIVLPREDWILQHLVGILAGDLVPAAVGAFRVEQSEITHVSLGGELVVRLMAHFRPATLGSIETVRRTFELDAEAPLLAYAFKPRAGIPYDRVRELTLGVLRAGFNYVVLDTRNTDVSWSNLDQWLDLIVEAYSLDCRHVTAFSPNLSMPTLDLLPIVERIVDVYPAGRAPLLKIDGGLDGISSIQAVRRSFGGSTAPIISSYPLLRGSMAPYLPKNMYVEFLALSGVDLLYPGGRPLLPHERRPIWTDEAAAVRRSQDLYRRMVDRGWPMPLTAGGVHAGQLHALFEIFGPDAGFFLGNAVALHHEGAVAGARLCARIVQEAVSVSKKLRKSRGKTDMMLSDGLIEELEASHEDIEYLPPSRIFTKESRLTRWYE